MILQQMVRLFNVLQIKDEYHYTLVAHIQSEYGIQSDLKELQLVVILKNSRKNNSLLINFLFVLYCTVPSKTNRSVYIRANLFACST